VTAQSATTRQIVITVSNTQAGTSNRFIVPFLHDPRGASRIGLPEGGGKNPVALVVNLSRAHSHGSHVLDP
jgi:hypothetical protein